MLSILSGAFVGFSLGLVGGGGSILAVPALLYVVGVSDAHLAIGTSALAVSVNAFANLAHHARAGTVKWPIAAVFAAAGGAGAFLGSILGKAMEGPKLLVLFAILMVAIAAAMFRHQSCEGDPDVRLNGPIVAKLAAVGFLTGGLSGFFGIGGGFLIVPGLMLASGIPILNAIGSSLFSVGSFGITTALSYAWSGLVNWTISALFIVGGVVGGFIGMWSALILARERGMLTRIFASLILLVAAYMLYRSYEAAT